jgi:hypothetical protein
LSLVVQEEEQIMVGVEVLVDCYKDQQLLLHNHTLL